MPESTGLPFWRVQESTAPPACFHRCCPSRRFLALRNLLALLDQQPAVVRVDGEETGGVADDDEVAVAAQAVAGVGDGTGRRGDHRACRRC